MVRSSSAENSILEIIICFDRTYWFLDIVFIFRIIFIDAWKSIAFTYVWNILEGFQFRTHVAEVCLLISCIFIRERWKIIIF